MLNKTQLQTNNTALDGYIARINAAKEVAASLPEAGGSGGSVETCTVQFDCNAPAMDIATVYYTNANLESATKNFDIMGGTRITVAKNTTVTVTPWTSMDNYNGCSKIIAKSNVGSYIITDDASIIFAS